LGLGDEETTRGGGIGLTFGEDSISSGGRSEAGRRALAVAGVMEGEAGRPGFERGGGRLMGLLIGPIGGD
jgi:hypothetical protein